MSIYKKRFSIAAAVCAEIIFCAFFTAAQSSEINIKINADAPFVAHVSGKFFGKTDRNWFFLKTIANADNLGARVSNFQLFDEQKKPVAVKKLIDGEYLADARSSEFQYQINLQTPYELTKAHVSWISAEKQGILMLDDLLPQVVENKTLTAKIKIELPAGWNLISNEKLIGEKVFEVKNIAEAVFVVGKNWRETETKNINLIVAGEWQFSDAEALQTANEIYETYQKLFEDKSVEKLNIALIKLPKEMKFGRWEAETRGRNLTILSADKPFKSQSIQLLHEQLRHEIFHFWIPNKLNLTGNYDWFYEGFTVYQALRTGVQTNQIRFEDFLATLGEAFNLDQFQTTKNSLIESSKNRWNTANPQVYARGMLVAFLCDLAILKDGKGKNSIENIFREIYQTHRFPNEKTDGSQAILKILKKNRQTDLIVKKYVETAETINWETDLQAIGIETATENSLVRLRVKSKLNGRQKDLLDKLGYNNWRKISRKYK